MMAKFEKISPFPVQLRYIHIGVHTLILKLLKEQFEVSTAVMTSVVQFPPLCQVSEMPQLTPPEDKTITSLYIGGVEPDVTEKDLR